MVENCENEKEKEENDSFRNYIDLAKRMNANFGTRSICSAPQFARFIAVVVNSARAAFVSLVWYFTFHAIV